MFAHPATHHFSRTYGGGHGVHPTQTTSKKNVNKENPGGLPSKTPSRMTGKMVPGTSMRLGLGVKTVGRDGNVVPAGSELGAGKGKGKEGDDIAPKRLFTNDAGPSKAMPSSKSFSSFPTIPLKQVTRTPAPKRQLQTNLRTPGPGYQPQPEPTPLPSANRTRRRSRQSLTPLKSTTQEFKTPAPSGKWEEEVSLGSINELMEGLDLDTVGEVEEEGDDEIEYMPPPVVELPFELPFELPDIGKVFGTLSSVPPLWFSNAGPRDMKEPELVFDDEVRVNVRLCDDDDLEEPIFRKSAVKAVAPAAKAQAPLRKPLAVSRNPAPSSRPVAPARKAVPPQTGRAPRTGAAAPQARPSPSSRPIQSANVRSRQPPIPSARPSSLRGPSGPTVTAPPTSKPFAPLSVPPIAGLDDGPPEEAFELDLGFDD